MVDESHFGAAESMHKEKLIYSFAVVAVAVFALVALNMVRFINITRLVDWFVVGLSPIAKRGTWDYRWTILPWGSF